MHLDYIESESLSLDRSVLNQKRGVNGKWKEGARSLQSHIIVLRFPVASGRSNLVPDNTYST